MIIKGSTIRIIVTIIKDGVACVLTGGSVLLRYKTPTGLTGQWTAIIDNSIGGIVHYDLQGVGNNEAGKWIVWAEATLADSSVLVTGATTIEVCEPGTIYV